MAQIVSQGEVSGETVRERLIEVEDFEEAVALDGVQVAVRERAHVRRGLADRAVLPEGVSEYVAFACSKYLLLAR